jgi:hypothetical protein
MAQHASSLQLQPGLLNGIDHLAGQRAVLLLDELDRVVVLRGRQVSVRADTEALIEWPPAGVDGLAVALIALTLGTRAAPSLHQPVDRAALCGREPQLGLGLQRLHA